MSPRRARGATLRAAATGFALLLAGAGLPACGQPGSPLPARTPGPSPPSDLPPSRPEAREPSPAARRFEEMHAEASLGRPALTDADLARYLAVLGTLGDARGDTAREAEVAGGRGWSEDEWLATRMRVTWVRMRLRLSKAPVAETMRADAEAVSRHGARLDAADPLE